jgi:tetratricopeptide (TPR) repeat protein
MSGQAQGRACESCGSRLSRYNPDDYCQACVSAGRSASGRKPATNTRPRPPDFLPADVLERPDFADACARRDLGEIFRIAIKRGGPGFTVSHIARRCGMSVGQAQKYTNYGRQAQKVSVFEGVADALHIPGRMLDIARRPWEDESDTGEGVSSTHGILWDDIETLRNNLTSAIGAGSIADNHIADWEQTALQYGLATRDQPPGILIRDIAIDLAELRRPLLECRSSASLARVTRVTAEMAGLMMLTFVKADERAAFRRWTRTARLAADETSDPQIQSWVRAHEAYGHYYSGDFARAVEVARHAQELGETQPCVGYVLAAALEARAHAALSADRREEAKKALQRAESVLSRLDAESTVPSAFGYNEEQLRFHESNVLTRLRDTKAAWQAQDRALQLCPVSDYTDRTLIQLDRAACLIQEHNTADAVEYAIQAISDTTPEQRRGVILLRAREIADSLPSDGNSSSRLHELHDLLQISTQAGEIQ